MPLVFLDSNIVIYYVEGSLEMHKVLRGRLEDEAGVLSDIAATDLTRLECRVGPLKRGDADLLKDYDRFFKLPQVAMLPMTPEIFDLAAQLRADHGIKTPDALHLAAAIHGGCNEFWTNDHRLANAAAGHIPIEVLF